MARIKLNDAIALKTFLSYVIAILFFFIMNVVLKDDMIVEHWWQIGWVKFIAYMSLTTALVLFGIERPGLAKFFVDLFAALRDGKLTAEEKIFLIESATDNIFSEWANLKAVVMPKEKEEKTEIDLSELDSI